MVSEAANQLLVLVEASEGMLDLVIDSAGGRRVDRMIRTLATQIIAGEYPVLKNVVEEERDQYSDIEFDTWRNIDTSVEE